MVNINIINIWLEADVMSDDYADRLSKKVKTIRHGLDSDSDDEQFLESTENDFKVSDRITV